MKKILLHLLGISILIALAYPMITQGQSSEFWYLDGNDLRPISNSWRVESRAGFTGSTLFNASHLRNCRLIYTNGIGRMLCGGSGSGANAAALSGTGSSPKVAYFTGTRTLSGSDMTWTDASSLLTTPKLKVTAAATPGGILYPDSAGELTHSPTVFFFDDTSKRFGVGTNNFASEIVGNDKIAFVDNSMRMSFKDNASGQGWMTLSSGNNSIVGFLGHTSTAEGWTIGAQSIHPVVIRGGQRSALRVDLSGYVLIKNSALGALTGSAGGALEVDSDNANTIGLIVKGFSGQSSNLQEWWDSNSNVGARVNASRDFSRPQATGSEQFGQGANATKDNSFAAGSNATATAQNVVSLGASTGVSGTGSVGVGNGVSISGVDSYGIGRSMIITGKDTLGIGNGTFITGYDSIGIGRGVSISHSGSIAFGRSAVTTTDNQMVLGSTDRPIKDIYFPQGVTVITGNAARTGSLYGSDATDSDLPGSTLQFGGGQGTGTGTGGALIFLTAPAGVSGFDLNALSERMIIYGSGQIVMNRLGTNIGGNVLTVRGGMSGSSLYVSDTVDGAGLVDCDGTTSSLLWDSTTKRFSCDTTAGSAYTAGQGLTLTSTSFKTNATLTGSLVRFTTLSGSLVYAKTTLASSGTLVFEGAASGSSLYLGTSFEGAGLSTDCDGSGNKVTWDVTTKRFKCETDQTGGGGGAGSGLNLLEISYDAADLQALETNFAPLIETGSTLKRTLIRAFDDTTEEYVTGKLQVPNNLDNNTALTVTFRANVVSKTAASANACLTFSHLSRDNGENFDSGTYTDEDSGAFALDTTQNEITEATWTETISNLGWVANDMILFKLSRDPACASDLTGDLWLFNFTVEIPVE